MKPLYRNPLALAVAAAISSSLATPLVLAQDDTDTDDASLEEVMVTGSRIAKQDFVSNSPVSVSYTHLTLPTICSV